MILDNPAYPSVDDTRGTNFPDVWHPGLTKSEFFLAHALEGALAAGANAEDAALTAWSAVEALGELSKTDRKGATVAKAEIKATSNAKQGSRN